MVRHTMTYGLLPARACRLPLEPWILLAGHSAEGAKEDCQNRG